MSTAGGEVHGTVEECAAELKALRRGWGLAVPKVESIGPVLRAACGVTDADGPAEVIEKVSGTLRHHAKTLPKELRLAVLVALGLHEPAQARLLTKRQEWLAENLLERDVRTVRRRIDDGSKALAQRLTRGGESAAELSEQWHTEWMWVALALDQPEPEALVVRHVVADDDGVDELDLATTLTAHDRPVAPDDMSVDVFAGGTLVRRVMESSDRIGLALRLPKPLVRGKRHEIVMRFRAPRMKPHYVCVPKGPCDKFDLSVRFGDRRPLEVSLLTKVFQSDLQDDAVRGEPLELDAAGEVRARFEQLAPGFAYGIRWDYLTGRR